MSSALPASTISPAYITITRSHSSATTARSCVISTMAMLVRSRSSRTSAVICACTVTSSAVLGSSAISSSGSHSRPIAIITRWRMPPEYSCGYWRMRSSGSGMRTARSISIAWARASSRFSPWWCMTTSTICCSIVR